MGKGTGGERLLRRLWEVGLSGGSGCGEKQTASGDEMHTTGLGDH